jgi:hypothetical protein
MMKTTQYFLATRTRPDRVTIRNEWIEFVLKCALRAETQADGRIRRWAVIDDADGRILRVVTLDDGETVHNAFFDRSFKP